MRTIVHLLASTFVGGPERQLLGLAQEMAPDSRTVFLTFAQKGRDRAFHQAAAERKFEVHSLQADTPWLFRASREITAQLKQLKADVLLCHGCKANLLGRPAARRAGTPVVAVHRGWTSSGLWGRAGVALDRFCLRWMDRVVCVSRACADKVLRAGVLPQRALVIPNAVDPERFVDPDLRYRTRLARLFRQPRKVVIGAAGRLSPEQGFDVLIAAAEIVLDRAPWTGFVLFGEGAQRSALLRQINASGLAGDVVLAGFRNDLDCFVPFFDLLVLPEVRAGREVPHVVLEAFAAGVPVVASTGGGASELIDDGANGYLVSPGDPQELADRLWDAIESEERLRDMGLQGRHKVLEQFTFSSQAQQYTALLDQLCRPAPGQRFEARADSLRGRREETARR